MSSTLSLQTQCAFVMRVLRWRSTSIRNWHLRPTEPVAAGPPYGAVQKFAYAFVVFIALPLMLLTGLTMSPAITAAFPFLLDLFGGFQSARTIHFFTFASLLLFLVVHVAMVFVTGAGRQLRAMTWGK